MILALIGVVLLVGGGLALVTGVLPPGDAIAIGERVGPVLLFVLAATVMAELAATAGVFDVAARWIARWAGGRTRTLWFLVAGLGAVATAFLSIDTTAVLLTPAVIAVARRSGLPVVPFALTTVWLANTASLFLPVSNVTNLLAVGRLQGGTTAFVALLLPSAVIAVVVSTGVLFVVHRRGLRDGYRSVPPDPVADRPRLIASGIVLAVVLPVFVTPIPPALTATLGAAALVVVFLVRSPAALRGVSAPWSILLFASGLFLAVGALASLGSAPIVTAVAGSGDDLLALWRMSAAGLVGANLLDNLPAYLLLEPAADSPARLGALLVGVNAGALVTPWASLAILLWHARLRAAGEHLSWRRFALLGAAGAPLTVLVATVPLALR